MSKLLTVFGATGNQGGSVVDAILADPQLSKEFKVRGITRDATKKSAQELVKRGVEAVTADLSSIDSLTAAIQGSHTVFLVTNYWEAMSADVEYSQGKNVADVCKAVGVSHLIFSSLHHVKENTNGRLSHVPHFDSKANVEKYIRASGVGCSFVLPGYYMSNLKQTLRRAEDGSYQLFFPVGKQAQFPLFDAAQDTGLFVKAAIKHADQLKNKQILAAAKYYTPEEIVNIFSEVSGKKAVFIQVSAEQYKAALSPAVADEFLENHLFVEEPGYYLGEPLEPSLKLVDSEPTTWAEFVRKNIATWK
ncbi:NAD(P)-binding protein [Aspergillus heteromorphus CBS 117.55]|uniref:NAD(P)-binding protein n=1 Tax=Aspergillus heteromorphus CBS 117.55 TaxID=1448321 RepID=A0A317VCE5_9EURO|nr:NAD(P)-binding protein [Aspergillus heteromorphus CBS 117.55]PWY70921.1 NAD(P)-binding protein [Aspergillus heteromorphus CBS 117.55]